MEILTGSDAVQCPGLRVVALDQVLWFLASPPTRGGDLPERSPEWKRQVACCTLCLLERREFLHASSRFYDELDRWLVQGLVAGSELSAAMESLLRETAAAPCTPWARTGNPAGGFPRS